METQLLRQDPSLPPAARQTRRRLTDEIRAMLPGDSLVTSPKVAAAAAAFFRGRGDRVVRKIQPDGRMKLWILAPEIRNGGANT